jgi:GntR family transcriptional regulator/MocR family aminotransferase
VAGAVAGRRARRPDSCGRARPVDRASGGRRREPANPRGLRDAAPSVPDNRYALAGTAARAARSLTAARFAIIEDDYDHEFHYDGRPILPLASADTAGTVIYVGGLSKTLAPGLRLGYIVATQRVIAHLTEYRSLLDTQGDGVLESAVAELIEDGELQRHVRKSRRVYRARRDAMVALLRSELGDAVNVSVPVGGTALWVSIAADVDVERWCRAAAAKAIIFETGDRFSFDNQLLPCIRLGYAGYRETELTEAVRLLAVTLAESRGPKRFTAAS